MQKKGKNKLASALLASLPMVATLGAGASLSGCGFQLRGYEAPLRFEAPETAIIIEDNRISFPLELPLTRRLEALGVTVVDAMTIIENSGDITNASNQIATIAVNNVRFRRYELVGVLTEIRLVLTADVTYQTTHNGQPITLSNPIQVERSYQYNEASVSTDDQQGSQIRDWLYDSLARRITDQYVAIGLPKVAPATNQAASRAIENSRTPIVITPTIVTPDP